MDFFMEQMKREQEEKLERYRVLNRNVRKGEILFTGSSLMEQFPINELLMTNGMRQVVYNRGIGGFTTSDMLSHMEEMVFGTVGSVNGKIRKDYRRYPEEVTQSPNIYDGILPCS